MGHHHFHFDSEEESTVGFFDRKLMSRLMKFVAPHKSKLMLGLVMMLSLSIATVFMPYLQKIAIDDYIVPPDAEGNFRGDVRGLTIVAIIYIFVSVFTWLVSFGQTYILVWMGQHVIYDIGANLFKHIQKLSMEFFDKRETGKIISRLTNDVQALSELLTRGIAGLIGDFVRMLTEN